ncbi:hypothetical protein U8335_15355 [Roseiconus lacunae]|uniref:hypothetical protein n=1 Tax=Roseiconus lacunae TaxID=2605694 RepID=UPI00308BE73B|nr:hypothetical protein U8335_15355 [Stieleria sp. HD01]
MFEQDSLHRRGKALEDEFFHRVDEKLGAALRARMHRDDAIERLKSTTGFDDQAVVEHLVDAGFTPSSIVALALVPMVFVAWADGNLTAAERQSILSAALHRGVNSEPAAFSMLEDWLHHRPADSLWHVWEEYANAVGQSLTPTLATMLHQEIMRLATKVANASGGHFGRGRISANERAVLDQLADLFAVTG